MTETFVDMDVRSGTPGKVTALPEPTITELFGNRVEERIFNNWAGNVHKLVWNFEPISNAIKEFRTGEGFAEEVKAVPSMLVHIDFKDGELEQAREKVRAKFIEHYKLGA